MVNTATDTEREAILTALASYANRGAIGDTVKKMSDLLSEESGRGVVIILGSMTEDILLERITRSFVPLSETQKKSLTKGMLGSFDTASKWPMRWA